MSLSAGAPGIFQLVPAWWGGGAARRPQAQDCRPDPQRVPPSLEVGCGVAAALSTPAS